MEDFIGGVILYDETIRQAADDGTPFPEVLAAKGVDPRDQGGHGRARSGRLPGREDHRRSRRPSRAARGVPHARRALRQVARGDHDRRRNPLGRMHPRERARARALRGAVPGGRDRPDRRARGADGRRQHDRALLRRDVAHAEVDVPRAARAGRGSPRRAAQAEHGDLGQGLPGAGAGSADRRADAAVLHDARSRGRSRASSSSPAGSRRSRRRRTSTRSTRSAVRGRSRSRTGGRCRHRRSRRGVATPPTRRPRRLRSLTARA